MTGAEAIRVEMKVAKQGTYFLPQPVGYGIDPGSVRLNGSRVPPESFKYRRSGEAVLRVSQSGTVRYAGYPMQTGFNPSFPSTPEESFTTLPANLVFPDNVSSTLAQTSNLNLNEKVRTALRNDGFPAPL